MSTRVDLSSLSNPAPYVEGGKASRFELTPKRHWVEEGYFQEAQIFFNKDRATLTYYRGKEVSSIHFDNRRGEIFLKGHRLQECSLSQEQEEALFKFGEYLVKEGAPEDLVQNYKEILGASLSQSRFDLA